MPEHRIHVGREHAVVGADLLAQGGVRCFGYPPTLVVAATLRRPCSRDGRTSSREAWMEDREHEATARSQHAADRSQRAMKVVSIRQAEVSHHRGEDLALEHSARSGVGVDVDDSKRRPLLGSFRMVEQPGRDVEADKLRATASELSGYAAMAAGEIKEALAGRATEELVQDAVVLIVVIVVRSQGVGIGDRVVTSRVVLEIGHHVGNGGPDDRASHDPHARGGLFKGSPQLHAPLLWAVLFVPSGLVACAEAW